VSKDAPLSFPDWTVLRAFLALVSTKSVDLAAGQLGVSIATVKRRLARLEDLIGAKLYSGYQRTFVLTEEGHQLAETLYRVDGLLSHAKPDLAMPTQNDKTKVSIWLMDVLFEMFLLPFYKANVELSRTYQISTTSGEMPELSQRFSNDITIAHYASANVAAKSVQVGVHQVAFGAAPAYFDTFGVPQSDNLAQHHLALVSDYRLIKNLWLGLEEIMLEVGSSIEMDSTAACHVMAKAGLHFTQVTQWSLAGNYELCPELPKVEMPVFLSYDNSFYDTPKGKVLTDSMIDDATRVFKANPEWFSPNAGRI